MNYNPPKPSKTRLFVASDEGWENSALQSAFTGWRDYSYCYRRAAEELAKRFEIPIDSPHAMFLPVLFLYRHAVEAALKGILTELAAFDEQEIAIPTHHRIDTIWSSISVRLSGRLSVITVDWFARAESLVEELSRVDPDSMYFRYPTSKSGAPLLRPGFTLSVKHLAEGMNELFFVLDNLAGYLEAANEFTVHGDTEPHQSVSEPGSV